MVKFYYCPVDGEPPPPEPIVPPVPPVEPPKEIGG